MKKYLYGAVISLLAVSPSGYCDAQAVSSSPASVAAAPLTSEAVSGEEASAGEPAVDFDTYRSNIDDMFQIALLKGPSMDRGINHMIVDLNRKIAENPQDPGPLVSLGHVYRILGQPAEANLFYEKALTLAPKNFHLNLFAATAYALASDLEHALEHLDSALKLHPQDLYAWNSRGRLLMLMNRPAEAIESFRKVLEIEPGNRQAQASLALLYPGVGKPEKALEVLRDLIQKEPRDFFVRYHTGAVYYETGKYDKALETWEGLFKDGVRDPQFLFSLSAAYQETGKPEQSAVILNHLHFMYPREPDIELMTAESYRQLNRPGDAEREYRLIIAENPGYLSAYMGLAHLLDLQGRGQERDEILEQAASRAHAEENLRAERQRQEAEKQADMEGVLAAFPEPS